MLPSEGTVKQLKAIAERRAARAMKEALALLSSRRPDEAHAALVRANVRMDEAEHWGALLFRTSQASAQ